MVDNRLDVDGRPVQPSTERVGTGTRAPLIVAAACVAFVALLVAKPWETPPPSATPPAIAASGPAPTATASATARAPATSSAANDPLPTPIAGSSLPAPDLAPVGPAGEFALAPSSDGYMASCAYSRARRGSRHLTSMEVLPPIALVENPRSEIRDIRQLSWYIELEMARRAPTSDGAWETVARSRRQSAPPLPGRRAAFTALSVGFDARTVHRTAGFRARVIVEWFTRNLELAGRVELIPTSYREGNERRAGIWELYCRGTR